MVALPDAETDHYNRPMPAGYFECYLHPETHDAEVFVAVCTSEGWVAYPLCRAAVDDFISKTKGQHGIREVNENTSVEFEGHIDGYPSNS